MGVLEEDDSKVSAAAYIAVGVRCGLSVRETLQAPVGLLLDMWEIYRRTHGMTEEQDQDEW